MNSVLNQLSQIESQITDELKVIDKKIKELRIERRKISAILRAFQQPKTYKRKKNVPEVGGTDK